MFNIFFKYIIFSSLFNTIKFENLINQVNKRIVKAIPVSDEKPLNFIKKIQEKFDLKNIGLTLANMINILKNIRDDVTLCSLEFPYANEIMKMIIESLYDKEGSICSMIEEYLLQKGLDVLKIKYYSLS